MNTQNKKIYIELGACDSSFIRTPIEMRNDDNYIGILIEADSRIIPNLYQYCDNGRTIIVNAAIVSKEYKNEFINLILSKCHPACNMIENNNAHAIPGGVSDVVKIKAMTLQAVLDQYNICVIDHFILDVEGAEDDVIEGIDHTKTQINYIEIELHGLYDGIKRDGTTAIERVNAGKNLFIPKMRERFNLELKEILHEDMKQNNPILIFAKPN